MSWRERKRFVVILILAAVLLAAPAGAATRPLGWEGLEAAPGGFLSQMVEWLRSLTAARFDHALTQEEGSTIDPNGTKSGSTIDPNGAKPDSGSSIDPDGAR
ncbi:MAG TPA: hypothetical protein VF173_35145 [Thermoanaerobaculia bacterium]|nr:hypothetical protein [Thermoanaerobaculia bacterium]